MAQTSRSADLTSGPMLQKIILFSIPLAASSILQLLFNAADVVVVGRFAGSTALAAVGSNGSLINLLVNLFVGLSLGANVVAARCFGAKDDRGVQDTVQTSVTLGLVSGVLLAVVGFFAARGLLELMSCPEDVIDLSALYLKIYFIGMPMTMLYNFSSALLRAVGDTKRPLYCLAAAGIINVVLNLVFVIGFSMSVAGVALATIISETVSACLVTAMLVREKGALHLDLHKLGFHAGALKQILLIGLPAGLQSTVFSLSNVVIQSAINSFGSTVVAGSSASSNLEGFVYTAMNAFAQAAVTFTSQNMGARKYQNLNRVVLNCLLCAIVTGVVLGGGAVLAGTSVASLFTRLVMVSWDRKLSSRLPFRLSMVVSRGFRMFSRSFGSILTSLFSLPTLIFILDSSLFTVAEIWSRAAMASFLVLACFTASWAAFRASSMIWLARSSAVMSSTFTVSMAPWVVLSTTTSLSSAPNSLVVPQP